MGGRVAATDIATSIIPLFLHGGRQLQTLADVLIHLSHAAVGIHSHQHATDALLFDAEKGHGGLQTFHLLRQLFHVLGSPRRLRGQNGDPLVRVRQQCTNIHARGEGGEVKFWLHPAVRVAASDGLDARTLRELAQAVEANLELIERTWNDYFR